MAEEALQLRHELKYIITEGEYAIIRDRLLMVMPVDKNALPNKRGYMIRSLYFDDIDNTAMWEKQDGVLFRHKYRLRLYNYSDKIIHLEKKIKKDQMTAKRSYTINRQQAEWLIQGNWTAIPIGRDPLLDEFYASTRTHLMRPVVIVDYFREAYTFPVGNVRITFDRDLHSGQFSQDFFAEHPMPVPVLPPGTLIMEVKYDDLLPPHIRGVLGNAHGQRSAMSKYALCRRFH